jgi:molybdopterin synthase catalytic subunit
LKTVRRQLVITLEPIDETELLAQRSLSAGMGAVVCFLGLVRGTEHGEAIDAIDYESFQAMAEHQFNRLFDEIAHRWPVESVRLVHRLGVVKVGEPSLWVEIVAPHRGEAFAACQWLIDEMKRLVPIWKKPLRKIQDPSTKIQGSSKHQDPNPASGAPSASA